MGRRDGGMRRDVAEGIFTIVSVHFSFCFALFFLLESTFQKREISLKSGHGPSGTATKARFRMGQAKL